MIRKNQVRGFADQRLRRPEAPLDPANRRISLIVQYVIKDRDEEDAKAGPISESKTAGDKPSAATK